MSSDTSKDGFNKKEYMYVRRLISVLTNDDSDKLIVEKLKGKNLSSLLYNAKVIDNSKNMAANKRILGCVIRAIEKEKHLCRRRDLDLSWGRKLLSSFNCLNPIKSIDDFSERSLNKKCKVHSKNGLRKNHKHQELSKHKQNQPVRFEAKTVGKRSSGFGSSNFSERKPVKSKNSIQTNVAVFDRQLEQYIFPCNFLVQSKTYETVFPVRLNCRQTVKYIWYPMKKYKSPKPTPPSYIVDKKTSSTQTFALDDTPEKEQVVLPTNIKLQDLLEAATNLINTNDQKEYVKSFLSNFEPPFDLTSGFPPYLKLPMKPADDFVNKESVYGSNSELSLMSGRISPRRVFESGGDEVRQKEERVNKYVRELSDPWQEAAESIISGVINESLPHDRADYSKLGACILKRLGAYPNSGFKDQNVCRMNTTVPEIVLSCTEWFESGTGEADKKLEQNRKCTERSKKCNNVSKTVQPSSKIQPDKKSSRESIEEIKLVEEDADHSKVNWERQRLQNFCFYEGSSNNTKVGLLDVSEGSITDVGLNTGEEVHEVAQDGDRLPQDRKHFPHREPLTISPSVLDQGPCRKEKAVLHKKNGGDGTRWCDNHVGKNQRNAQEKKPIREEAISSKSGRDASSNLKQVGISNDKVENAVEENTTATVANLSVFVEPQEVPKDETAETTYVSTPDGVEQDATPGSALWEPTAAEVETFDGIGECHGKMTDLPKPVKSPSDKKVCTAKARTRSSFQDRFRGKKKCKNQGQTKKTAGGKDEVDISKNCKVM
ncbi:hypothetical protein GE061_017053 [Apolygus lucorum]|uniref:Uncharacterized protein n=1 Tax=Apolygus lucorum TaxID=248454 RepID=A0A6A4JM62_APOLU|nr:hypothetical protein GE061_017053 [Apolygus lucorum]